MPIRLSHLCLLMVCVLAAAPLAAVDGELDPAFAGGAPLVWGNATTDLSANDARVAPDGALAVAGGRVGQVGFYWYRVTDAGVASTCIYSPPGATSAAARAVAFDSDGRLLVAGTVGYSGLGLVVGVARFHYPDCILDTSFDGDGYVTFDSATDLTVTDVAVARYFNGLILVERVVVLAQDGLPADATLAIVSLRPDGTPDTAFSGDGVRIFGLGGLFAASRPVGLVSTGVRLLFAATGEDGSGIGDYFAGALDVRDGSTDTGWNDPLGYRVVDVGFGSDDTLTGVLIDPSGRLLLSGLSVSGVASAALVRLDGDGLPDPTLDGDGLLVMPISAIGAFASTAVAVDSADRIQIAGNAFSGGAPAVGVARLLDSGALDPGFGSGGHAVHPLNVYPETDDTLGVAALAIWGGRATLAGAVTRSGESRAFAVRLTSALIFRHGFERGSTGGWAGF